MQPFKYNPNNNTGSYRHRIAIHKRTITVDELQQEHESFEEVTKLWAMIKTLKGEEVMNGDTSTVNTSRFVVRYSKFLYDLFDAEQTSLEIHYRGVIYDIKEAINDNEMNITYTIVAEGRL